MGTGELKSGGCAVNHSGNANVGKIELLLSSSQRDENLLLEVTLLMKE